MKLIALLALVPVAIGPLPADERTITVALCLGGEITIPIGGGGDDPQRRCHAQGCHAGTCREKSKGAARSAACG